MRTGTKTSNQLNRSKVKKTTDIPILIHNFTTAEKNGAKHKT